MKPIRPEQASWDQLLASIATAGWFFAPWAFTPRRSSLRAGKPPGRRGAGRRA